LKFPINKEEGEEKGEKEEEREDNNKIIKEEEDKNRSDVFNCTIYGSPWQPEFW
jgi:hypothetical protein